MLAANSCEYADTDFVGSSGPTVDVGGDSITVGSADLIHANLLDHRVKVKAVVGNRWSWFVGTAPSDVQVVLLGTNLSDRDGTTLTPDATPVTSWTEEQAIMDAKFVRSAPCVVMATVTNWSPSQRTWLPDLNVWVRSHADVVVEWDAAVTGDPSLVNPDGVHPTEAGKTVFANLVADAVRLCPT